MARETVNIPIGPIYAGDSCRGMVHVIERGDTLYNLGKRYHVSVTQLMFANPYVNVYNLQVGDELCIPTRMQPREEEIERMGGAMREEDRERTRGNMGERAGEGMMREGTMREGMGERMGGNMGGTMREGTGQRMGERTGEGMMREGTMREGMGERMRENMGERTGEGMMREGMGERTGEGMMRGTGE